MKKIWVSFCLMIGIGISAHAQRFNGNTVTERTKIGIQGGLSVPWQHVGGGNDDYSSYNTDAFAGFTGGLQLEVPLGNGWYLQPEANFTQMGGKDYITPFNYQTNKYEDNAVYTKVSNNYIQVPVYIKYKPMLQGLGLFFGPQYGYMLNYKEKYLDNVGGEDKTTFGKNRNEISLAYGVEYYFPSKNDGPSFGFAIKGMSGLSNIIDKNKFDGYMSSVYNNAFFVTVGVRF